MKFFSKITLICNLCFIVMFIMQYMHIVNKQNGKTDAAIPLAFAEGTIAVLGLLSFLINAVFILVCLMLLVVKANKQIPRWIVWLNFIILVLQVYWFVIDKS